MSVWSKIFGTENHVTQGLNIIERAGDALFYTDEEKAADRANKAVRVNQFLIDWMETTKGQNIARRLLAVIITVVWLTLYLFSIILATIAPWVSQEVYPKIIASSITLAKNADQMSGAVMLILAFYFAAHHIDKVIGPAIAIFTGKDKAIK